MARFLLDTDILISLSKAQEPAYSWVRSRVRAADEVGICGVNVAEFLAGIAPPDRLRCGECLRLLAYWDLSYQAAAQAGIYRYTFARQGITISTQDALAAAVAVEAQATLVTGDVKHFPMPEVFLLTL